VRDRAVAGALASAGERVSVRVCVNSRCGVGGQRAESLPTYSTNVAVPVSGTSAKVSVSVRDAAGRLIARGKGTARVVVVRANGPDCPPPPCHRIHVRLEGTRLVSLARQ